VRRVREAGFVSAALGISLLVFLPWLGFDLRLEPHKSALNDYWKARVPEMVYGRAHRPFVQRALVPFAIRAIRSALPRSALSVIRRMVSGPPLRLPRKLGVLGWEPAFVTEYAIAMVVLFAILAAFPFALRRLFRALYDAPGHSHVAPLLATLLLPGFFFDRGTHYLYDFSTLLIFTLALAFLAEERLGLYYLVLVLGAVNKETIVLMILVYAVVRWDRSPRRVLVRHVVAQVVIVGSVLWALNRAFSGNPGNASEWHLAKNLRLMLTLPSVASLLALASASLLVFVRPGDKPEFLRRALIVLPPLVVTYVCLGIYGEIRVFYEAYPILFLLAFHNGSAALGKPLSLRGERAIVAPAS
jgi:hypothetical protein